MEILSSQVTTADLKKMAGNYFSEMVKAVVDIGRELVALDAELHSDLESILLEDGSRQDDLWGINLYPEMDDDTFVEFDSTINLRPSQGNRSRGVDSPEIRQRIIEVVNKWVKR